MPVSTDTKSSESSIDSAKDLEGFMESFVRVTLAGLGGSLIGLSRQNTIESQRIVSGSAAAAAARRKRSPSLVSSNNLPLSWAISCISFCALVEGCRIYSPSKWILNQIEESQGWSLSENEIDGVSAASSVGDYTIGGAIAGVLSSLCRNAHLRQRLPSSLLRGPQPMFGFVPGITLGFVAGILQASIDYGESSLISLQTKSTLEITKKDEDSGSEKSVQN